MLVPVIICHLWDSLWLRPCAHVTCNITMRACVHAYACTSHAPPPPPARVPLTPQLFKFQFPQFTIAERTTQEKGVLFFKTKVRWTFHDYNRAHKKKILNASSLICFSGTWSSSRNSKAPTTVTSWQFCFTRNIYPLLLLPIFFGLKLSFFSKNIFCVHCQPLQCCATTPVRRLLYYFLRTPKLSRVVIGALTISCYCNAVVGAGCRHRW